MALSNSSCVQDFYNLVDVYLDAVLYPNCVRDEKTFAQEGWHFELENPEVRTSTHALLSIACLISRPGGAVLHSPAKSWCTAARKGSEADDAAVVSMVSRTI